LTEEIKGAGLPEESVIRILEQQSRYGMDQDTMLIYMNSVNLMNILNLISRRQGGSMNLSIPAPAVAPALPALATGSGPTLDNLMGMLLKMLGSQGGGNSPGGQGINPAMLMNLLSVLGQNVDLGGLMSMLAGLMGTGAKPVPRPESGNIGQSISSGESSSPKPGVMECGVNEKTTVEDKSPKREPPRIMKWDQIDDRKKA